MRRGLACFVIGRCLSERHDDAEEDGGYNNRFVNSSVRLPE
jgi:hypothetical protein